MSVVWLNTESAAQLLDYKSKSAKLRQRCVYRFLKRHGIVPRYDGPRRLLIAKADIDRALTQHVG